MRRFRVRKWATPHCGVAKKALAHPLPTNLLLHKIFAGALKEGAAIISLPPSQREVPRARMLRARGGRLFLDFSGSFPIKAVLFFRQNPQAPFFPLPENRFFLSREGDDVQCVKRGEGPPKKLPRRARQEVGITSSLVAVKRGGPPQKKHPRPVKRKGRHNPRPRKQQKNSSSARPHGGGIYLPNSVVTGAGRFGTSRLELNVESNFRCDHVGRSLQVLFIRSALRPFGEIVRWSVLLIRDLPRLTGNEVCHIKRTSRYEIFSE